jgi:hypothetical protein
MYPLGGLGDDEECVMNKPGIHPSSSLYESALISKQKTTGTHDGKQ